jgi:hypothetical protein
MFQKFAITAAFLLSAATAARAASVTVPLATVTDTSATLGGLLILPEFNNSLGTLTGVTLNFGPGSVAANIGISDLEPSGGTINITYQLGYAVTFDLPVGGPFVAQDAQNITCSGFNVEISSCNSSMAISLNTIAGSYDLSSFAPFFEIGNVDLTYTPSLIEQVVGSTIPASPANLALSVTGESLTMPSSLVYTYTTASTPEPSSFVLLADGLAALAWTRRKLTAPRRLPRCSSQSHSRI